MNSTIYLGLINMIIRLKDLLSSMFLAITKRGKGFLKDENPYPPSGGLLQHKLWFGLQLLK